MEKITLPFEKIYVLSLVEHPERLSSFNEEIKNAGIANDITPWYACLHPHCLLIANILKSYGKYIWNGAGNGNAFSCTREHYSIIKQAYYRGFNNILIFEDDFQFISDLSKVQDLFKKPLPDDWDLIQYGIQFGGGVFPQFGKNDISYTPITKDNHYWGTNCYALSRRGMKYYIDYMDEHYSVADYPLYDAYSHSDKVNAWAVSDNICVVNDRFETTIQ